ncbi:MAG: tetratricopeptide repeat protein [Elusimicrobiota bacterium]|nr:MAG: tetratricopeptide repeat protein [Elusimicrobiota bacterium]
MPHAPGYATWTVLAKAFGTALPLGDWAHRANLLSALCGAAALALLCDALRRWGAGRAARVGAAVILGLTPLWREQSAVAEAFAPLALAAAGLLWLTAAAGPRLLDPGPAAALGLVFGAGLGLHQTLILVLPALVLAAGRAQPRRLAAAVGWAALGAAAGFALHFAILLRATAGPPMNMGGARTPERLLRLLLRQDYGTFSLTTSAERGGAWGQVARFARSCVRDFGSGGLVVGLLGAAAWNLRLPRKAAAAWVLCAGQGFLLIGRPGFDPLTSAALERFSLLPFVGLALFIGAGLSYIEERAPRTAAAIAALAALSLLPGAAAASRRDDWLALDYGRGILKSLPKDAVLVMDGGDDTFYSLSFLTAATGLRPDVALHDRGGVVFPGLYGDDFRLLPRESREARRLDVERPLARSGRLWYSTLNDRLLPEAVLVPAGLLRRPAFAGAKGFDHRAALDEVTAVRRSRAGEALRHRDRALAAFIPYQRGVAALSRGDAAAGASWLGAAAEAAPDAAWTVPAAAFALGVAGYEAVARKDYAAAEAVYREGAALEPAKAEPLVNLGVTLEKAGRFKEAEEAFRAAARREPRWAPAWSSLGALLWARSRWADAADAFDSAAALGDPRAPGFAAEARKRSAK